MFKNITIKSLLAQKTSTDDLVLKLIPVIVKYLLCSNRNILAEKEISG